jgi:pimeloyl-ACP methyl ester carboxylesterase
VKRILLRAGLGFVIVYVALVGIGFLGYRLALYPAPRRALQKAPARTELREYRASDGQGVQVLVHDAPAGAPAVVFFHGNGETIADGVPIGEDLRRRGLRFVAVEYRGYGGSPSAGPCEAGLYADAEGALAGLRADGTLGDRVTLWGRSLGSGVAVEMIVRGLGQRLVLEAPYTSIPDVASHYVPFLPMHRIIGDRYDSLSKAASIGVPTLVVHGDSDRVVPYAMGKKLSETIAGAVLFTVAGAGHNDLYAHAGGRILARIGEHALGR